MESQGPKAASRWDKAILIVSTLLGSWLAMQMVHELGHMTGAWISGGRVSRVSLDLLGFSRTDLERNPRPLLVAWSGPVLGVVLPLALALLAARLRLPGAFVIRFFAGFCLVANGLYLGIGSFSQVGDCGDILRGGSAPWSLWLFGAIAFTSGLTIWNQLGKWFGLGAEAQPIDRRVAGAALAGFLALAAIGFAVGR